MRFDEDSQINFISELAEYQISASELFNQALLDSLERNFDLKNTMIYCYDKNFNFLSWTDRTQVLMDSPSHPYHMFSKIDSVPSFINRESTRDHMSYDNTTPKVYRATDILQYTVYENTSYAMFLQNVLHYKYSAIMPFGTNGFIHLVCYKTEEEGDFTDDELNDLRRIYIFVAHTYKTFKKYEQGKIIREIQNKIIQQKETAYIITDSEMHILAYNDLSIEYMTELFGIGAMSEHLLDHCTWLPFLLENQQDVSDSRTKTIKGFQFKINTWNQTYHHGIIETYYWITMNKPEAVKAQKSSVPSDIPLTPAEQKVADLLCEGLTYQAIADQLYISYHTVKTHVQNIFSKYGVKSRHELYQLYKAK